MTQGYYRYPAIFKDTLIFVSEDDLWSVPAKGGTAVRLTTGLGTVASPVFSPDGKTIAFAGSDEGPTEVYITPKEGGAVKRLTFLGDLVKVHHWGKEGIYLGCSAGQPFQRCNIGYLLRNLGQNPESLKLGPINFIDRQREGGPGIVIQRHGYREYGFWKRYRGGTAGEIWIDVKGNGQFKSLITLESDLARPLWIKDRIYFASDHEGVGNLYSCKIDGKDLKRHTHHMDYYVRHQATDGHRIVYQAGADLYVFDIEKNKSQKVSIAYHSPRSERSRKFVYPKRYLESYALHPKGHHLQVITRGKGFVFSNWEGPVLQFGEPDGVRYRHGVWLKDGKHILMVSDQSGEDGLEIYNAEHTDLVRKSPKKDFGRILNLVPSPKNDEVVFTNHRNELMHVDLKTWKTTLLDKSSFAKVNGVSWSPDGRYVAYSASETRITTIIKIVEIKNKKIHKVTRPVLRDVCPVFDPQGKYLYFLSYRQFDPTWDSLHFELGFPRGMRPYLILLQKDAPSPFMLKAKSLVEDEEKKDKKEKKKSKDTTVKIDFEGIEDRLQAFPVPDGIYGGVGAVAGKALFLHWPIEGTLENDESDENSCGLLEAFDFETLKVDVVANNVTHFEVSLDGRNLAYRNNQNRLRVFKADEKPDEEDNSSANRKSGWVDLSRIRVSVNPPLEWQQVFKEAWRLQRDYFWAEDMSKIDWTKVYHRYFPLLDRISNRSELNDLLWEMQGELGTSHAYVFGGDVKHPPFWEVGNLAASLTLDPKQKAYTIHDIVKGDVWNPSHSSPLVQPGVNVKEGDLLRKINGRTLSVEKPPASLLVHQAHQQVTLEVSDKAGKNKRYVTVKTLGSDFEPRYRDWVENNRAYVHKKSKGRVGYVHIPDMSSKGFSEFHRYFLDESEREGLIVDIRYNGGGSVSPLILEKLARRRLGYDVSRWNGLVPYPEHAPMGPMVSLINEYAGSDGDMFAQAFRLMKLGPSVGKRTWGGIIGINPTNPLVDGGMTTQPEFSFWFKDVGWSVENRGVDPDIFVEFTPADYRGNRDPQLDRGLEELSKIMKKTPKEQLPDAGSRPNLSLPKSLRSK